MERALTACVVVGNNKANSRTSEAGVRVAEALLSRSGLVGPDLDGKAVPDRQPSIAVVELSELSGALFTWGDPQVSAAKQRVLAADLLIVASPVYKASYTGLLKAFLDQFGKDELGAKATVPVMVGAGPAHALAIDGQLRPVLVEIGASCPSRGLYVLESELDSLDVQLEQWMSVWGRAVLAVATSTFAGSEPAAT